MKKKNIVGKKRLAKALSAAVSASMLLGSAGMACAAEGFDASWYAMQNPDVAAVFGTDPLSLYTHYITIGQKEGRFPSAAAKAASSTGFSDGDSNPYARFASASSGGSHHSHSSASSDEDMDEVESAAKSASASSGDT